MNCKNCSINNMLVYIHYLTGIQLSPRNWIVLLSQSPDLMTLMLFLFCGFTGFVVFVILREINRYIYSNLICIHQSSCCFRKPINFFSGLSYKTFVSMIWYHLLLGKWWLGFKVFRFSYVEEVNTSAKLLCSAASLLSLFFYYTF